MRNTRAERSTISIVTFPLRTVGFFRTLGELVLPNHVLRSGIELEMSGSGNLG